VNEWGIVAAVLAALVGLATFIRVVVSEANRATRQLEILQTIDSLRREISDSYVTSKVFDHRMVAVDLRFQFVEDRVTRIENGRMSRA
jgi:hypothetical protein